MKFSNLLSALGVALCLGLVCSTPVGAEPTRVDIYIAYTPAARANAGSDSAMRAAINSYIASTNLAYANSDIDVVLTLVGSSEVAYTESGDFLTDLQRLQVTNDGYLDAVHAFRTNTGADLVSLIRRNSAGGVAGIAYIGNNNAGFGPYAFSVVADNWALANYAFPHELGHNFGCQHNRTSANTTPVQPYAYGHHFTGTDSVLYRTIMAYPPGTVVPYFSNPSISYKEVATGVSGGATPCDNAMMHEYTAAVTAAYKPATGVAGSGVRGDFDGDGRPDLVLHNPSTGALEFWLMNGISRTSIVAGLTTPPPWRLATAADMNDDGKSDLIWENTSTGARVVWYMNGTARTGTANLLTTPVAWTIVGAGDFNGDGKADLVWENKSTGARAVWYMNGATRTGAANLLTTPLAWHIAAVADLNNDGSSDIIFENTTNGTHAVWYMNGVTRVSTAAVLATPLAWKIGGAADFNGDGRTDLVFENTTDGSRVAWYMNGATRLGSAWLPSAATALKISNH